MSIVAALDKVLFFNASSKYSVLRMKTEDSSVPTEARSPYRYHDHLIRFTAVGIELPQTDTVKIEMDGEWKDGKYGLQLQVDHWQEIVPPIASTRRLVIARPSPEPSILLVLLVVSRSNASNTFARNSLLMPRPLSLHEHSYVA